MSLRLLAPAARVDAPVLVLYEGEAWRRVAWAVTSGPASVSAITDYTDETGRAGAILTPSGTGSVTVEVTAGA